MPRASARLPRGSPLVSLRQLPGKLALSATTLVATLILGEIAARIWLVKLASSEQFLAYASYFQYTARYAQETPRHSPHWYLGYYATPDFVKPLKQGGENRHNSIGFRGDEIEMPKPEGRFRIACLGGSTTYTTGIHDHTFAYPRLLGEELVARGRDVDVINAGLAGWASWETLINFQIRVLDLDPDLIIVYHAVNDLHCRMVWPPEAFTPDNTGRHQPRKTVAFIPPVWESSTLLRILGIHLGIARPHRDQVAELRMPVRTFVGNDYFHQWREGTYPSGIFEEATIEEILEQNPPIHFRRNIENIVAVAKSRRIEVVLATFAHSPEFSESPWSADPVHQRGYAEHNAITRDIAAEMGVPLIDLASRFPRGAKYYTDGIHVTRVGAKLKARMVAEYLLEEELVPPGSR